MVKGIALAVGMVCLYIAGFPAMAGQLNANCGWNCAWAPPSASDQSYSNSQALLDFQLRNGILNPGVSTSSIYNGTVNQTYTGPNSSSGSSVMNIDNLNSTTTNTTALGGSKVNVTTSTTQKADGSTQSGAATANSATIGKGVFDANNTISTGN